MYTHILDREALVTLVTDNREAELTFPEFTTVSITRKGNSIIWVYEQVLLEEVAWTLGYLLFAGKRTVALWTEKPFCRKPGDKFTIDYKLSWYWEGPDKNGVVMRKDIPFPGATIQFVRAA